MPFSGVLRPHIAKLKEVPMNAVVKPLHCLVFILSASFARNVGTSVSSSKRLARWGAKGANNWTRVEKQATE